MKTLLARAALATALVLSFSTSEAKNTVEMSQLTCKDLLNVLEETPDSFAVFVVWIDGYLGGVVGNTEFDPDYMGELSEALVTACSESPKKNVIAVAREVAL